MARRNVPQGMPAGGMPPQAMSQRGSAPMMAQQATSMSQPIFGMQATAARNPNAGPMGMQQVQSAQQQMQGAMPQRQMQNPYGGGIGAAIGDLQSMFGGMGSNIGTAIAGMYGARPTQQQSGFAVAAQNNPLNPNRQQQQMPAQMQQQFSQPYIGAVRGMSGASGNQQQAALSAQNNPFNPNRRQQLI
jgi:hypothetical protein